MTPPKEKRMNFSDRINEELKNQNKVEFHEMDEEKLKELIANSPLVPDVDPMKIMEENQKRLTESILDCCDSFYDRLKGKFTRKQIHRLIIKYLDMQIPR